MIQNATKWKSITLILLAQVLTLSLWFSATAVIPSLRVELGLSNVQASLFSSMVAIGFVGGTLISALLGLADRFNPKYFFLVSALVAACANGGLLLVEPHSGTGLLLRTLTGAAMAGIYPIGMKMASTWAEGDVGWLVGLLVGALTLGSASPHLLNALGGLDWRTTIGGASLAAMGAAFVILFVRLGPKALAPASFRWNAVYDAWKYKPLRLANLGYFGHMWELYAMWAWIGVFMTESFTLSLSSSAPIGFLASLAGFSVIAVGAVGCLAGGWLADRYGRTRLTMWAMGISGSCAILAGFLFGASPWILVPVCWLWGFSIVADSAQFSACIIELSDQRRIGTMLTVQTSLGFLLTLATIHLVPMVRAEFGWAGAFGMLAIGPYLGVLVMGQLKSHADAKRIAGGLG